MITSEDKEGFLYVAYWQAQASSISLFAFIKAAILGKFQVQPSGLSVVATAGNGRSTQFTHPDFMKFMTPDDARHLWVQMLKTYNTAVLELLCNLARGFAPSIPARPQEGDNSQDQTIFDQMLCSPWLKPITSSYLDMTMLRLWPEYDAWENLTW